LVGILVSCAALVAGRPVVGANGSATLDDAAYYDACLLGGPACEAPALNDEPTVYANPVEVNCPAPDQGSRAAPAAGTSTVERGTVSGGCSPADLVFHYRVSRLPESERPSGALRPQRARRNGRPVAACTGLPPEHGLTMSPTSAQPIAVYAMFDLLPPPVQAADFEAIDQRPTRILEPLDRPPRV
jgi:hypothetical protein